MSRRTVITLATLLAAAALVIATGCGDQPSSNTDGKVGRTPTMVGFMGARQEDSDYSFFVMDLVSGNQTRLAPAFTMLPPDVWSPDGTLLAYLDRDAFPAHAYWMALTNADGEDRRKIADLTENYPATWSWSADARSLVTLCVVGGKAEPKPEGGVDERYYTDLFSLDLATGQTRRLTDTQSIGEWAPFSSPDGKKIAFAGTEYDPETWKIVSYGIYTLGSDGADQVKVLTSPTPVRTFQWSPDSKKIAYCTDDGKTGIDSSEIHVVDLKTGADLNLTNTPSTGELDPAWSPDGKKIAFYSGTFREGYRLRVMDADGKNAVDLTEPGEYPRGGASWSPDGKTILFTDRSAIYSVGADGKDLKVILDGKGTYRDMMYPVWLFE